jgi:ABC-type lipoprotein release transport system permease subunit
LIFGIASVSGVAIAVITTVLIGISLLAAFVPARRATRVDPMTVLRRE